MTRLNCFISVVCNKLTTVSAPTKNCSLADIFILLLLLDKDL